MTAHLADLLMRDSAHIQESDAEEGGRGDRSSSQNDEPLYTQEDALKVKQYFMPTLYDQPFEVVPGVTAKLVNAGHILGSAAVWLEVEESNGDHKGTKKHRIWFSGDIGRPNMPIVRDPVLPTDATTLIMECTYGDRDHGDPLETYDKLKDVLARTIERGGRVIIPAFAVGRTQEIVYNIHQMLENGDVPRVPVFVDSPLASEASKVFIEHPEYFDDEARNFIRNAGSWTALGFNDLTYVESARDSRAQ